MLLATINSSIILIALVIFRRIHLEPLSRRTRTTYSGPRHASLLPPPFCTIGSRELRDNGRLRKRLRRTEWGRWLLARLRNCICTASI
jgi:hypothetical protein